MTCVAFIDAGHSKATGGKRNTIANPKFYEYEFNNDVAVRLKARLEAHGIKVYLTNTSPEGADIGLTARANTANNKWAALGKPNAIFVSIHGNAAGSCASWANARGVEVYHATNASANSKKLAKLLTDQIYADLHAVDSGFKQRGVKSAGFTVIQKANMPSVLIEHAFYDNKADLNLMQNHRKEFIEADCKAICKYFGIAYKASGATNVKPVEPTKVIESASSATGNSKNVPSTNKPFKNGDYNIRAQVTAKILNVRKGRPGQAGYDNIIGELKMGDIVEVGYCLNNWFGISFKGKQAFICGDYVNLML